MLPQITRPEIFQTIESVFKDIYDISEDEDIEGRTLIREAIPEDEPLGKAFLLQLVYQVSQDLSINIEGSHIYRDAEKLENLTFGRLEQLFADLAQNQGRLVHSSF